MPDITVILDRKELVVRMDSGAIRIDQPGHKLKRIPLNMIERVIVIGKPLVSCDVWRTLAQKNIPAVLLPSRGDTVSTYLGPGLNNSANIRMGQYSVKINQERVLDIARWLFGMKLKGQIAVLEKLSNKDSEILTSCHKIDQLCSDMKNGKSINSLMGYEGSAAVEYFKSLSRLLPGKWNFSGRNRRPPKDPVNALLSLSYVIAGSEVRSVIHKKGFDPAMGLVHSIQAGRESLMLDILEPVRPVIDEFVLWLIDKRLSVKEFVISDEKCLLNKNGRKIYYYEWSKWLSGDGYCSNKVLKVEIEEIATKLIEDFFNL